MGREHRIVDVILPVEIAEADGFDRAVGEIFGPGRRAATAGYRFVHGLSPQTLPFRHRTALQTLDDLHDPAPEATPFWRGSHLHGCHQPSRDHIIVAPRSSHPAPPISARTL